SGSILFEHLLLSDEGHYECLVSNSAGSVLSSKAYLRVKNTYFVPKIIDKVDQIGVRFGHNANLTCRAAGNPIPTTRWLTDSERSITEFTEGVSTLFLADITEPARYICEANNSLGTVQHPVRIQIIEVPPPPTDLICLEKGPTFAFLQWLPAKQSMETQQTTTRTIDSYTLFLYELENGQTITNKKQLTDIPARQFHLHGALQYKLTDLKPYTMYLVEVCAVSNLLGMSDPSNKVNFITKELSPSSAPCAVETIITSDDSVLVSWKPPKEANGKIIGYNVFYNQNPQTPLNQWQKVNTQFESVKLEKLHTSETYHIRINAYNSAGESPLTDAYQVLVKFGVPSQPREFIGFSFNPNEIHLSWIAPNLPVKIGLQDYLLKYRLAIDVNSDKSEQQKQQHQQQPVEIKLSPDLTEYLMENLIPNSTYHISLAARTKFGAGIAAQIKVQTDSNVPGPPILHELSILDSFSIRIRWLAPHNVLDNINISQYLRRISNAMIKKEKPSKVLHYLVQWSAFPFTDWEQNKVSINYLYPMQQIYEYIVHGLLSRTTYRIRIIAVGSEGMSPALELGPIKTKGQVPSAPRNLRLNQLRRATPPGSNDPKAEYAILELAWDPPERTHGDIRGYQVSHRLIGPVDLLYASTNRLDPESRSPSKPIIRNVTQTAYTSVSSDGIKFGRTYQFEVAAYNGVDLGLPAQINISTPEDVPGSYSLHVRVKGLSATAIEVSWTPPLRQKWAEEITSYQVRYFQPSAPNETEIITTTQEPIIQIENLKERTFYTVLVRALTKNGPGPWSAASTIRTTAECN
ncbi:Receptor-type tyrosine-protein phosphatase F, partial [Schistosoma japonicum]